MNEIPDDAGSVSAGPRKSRLAFLGALSLFFFVVFCALGIWQLERLSWKVNLIARVQARVDASPMPIPAEKEWPAVNPLDDEYRHVTLAGRFLNDKETLVYASTERGPGYWVLTPLQLGNGAIVFVNRGYVPLDKKEPESRAASETSKWSTITGLLRMNEPKGTMMRSNDPAQDRWYSRDVTAMGARKALDRVAPFFIDADATPNPGGLPVGGLTVVSFPNSHMSYAMTWFAMAALSLVGGVILVKAERRRAPTV